MRSKEAIRKEVEADFKGKGREVGARTFEREVDRRYHWERLIHEAEEYEKKYGPVKIEFMAAPDDEMCKQCWELNGQSITLDELKKRKNRPGCRCAIVLPDDEE